MGRSKRKSRHTIRPGPWVVRERTFNPRGGGIADAVSNAGLGFLGGAPRNPQLKVGGPEYSFVLHVNVVDSYTAVDVSWFNELRGIDFFRRLQVNYDKWRDENPGLHGEVQIVTGTQLTTHTPCSGVFIESMPAWTDPASWDTIVDLTQTFWYVADVTADVYGINPDHPASRAAAEQAAAEHKTTPEGLAFWEDPDNVARHLDVLRLAKVITTSWPHLVKPLRKLTGRPVVYLPDFQGDGSAFTQAFILDVLPIALSDNLRHKPLRQRVRFKLALLRRALARPKARR